MSQYGAKDLRRKSTNHEEKSYQRKTIRKCKEREEFTDVKQKTRRSA